MLTGRENDLKSSDMLLCRVIKTYTKPRLAELATIKNGCQIKCDRLKQCKVSLIGYLQDLFYLP